jgi:hypothetical protein
MAQPIFHTPDAVCPVCAKALTGTGPIGGSPEPPTPGTVTVCMGCGAVAVFTDDLRLRLPTPAEWQGLRADADAWATIEHAQHERLTGRWRDRLPGTM